MKEPLAVTMERKDLVALRNVLFLFSDVFDVKIDVVII